MGKESLHLFVLNVKDKGEDVRVNNSNMRFKYCSSFKETAAKKRYRKILLTIFVLLVL